MLRPLRLAPLLVFVAPALADDFASQLISYTPGTNPVPGFTTPAAALGEPTRFTGVGVFPGAVTPFNPPWMISEIVSLGTGGSLVVRFDQPITNNPAHPYGQDLLIFGNAGYVDLNFPQGQTSGALFSAGRGRVEVSADGLDWRLLPGAEADAAFPTLGYADLTDPYATDPGAALSDFTRPVDPGFNPAGLSFPQLAAAYAGSGGGTGIDIAASGLASISFIRITNLSLTDTVEIDALSRVAPIPAPATVLLAFVGAGAILSRPRARP
jgi:hypothetical protein